MPGTQTDHKSAAVAPMNGSAAAASQTAAANSSPNTFQMLRDSAAVVALTKPVVKEQSAVAADAKSAAQISDADKHVYKPNVDFKTFDAVKELEKIQAHVLHCSALEAREFHAGESKSEVSNIFEKIKVIIKDTKSSNTEKANAYFSAAQNLVTYISPNRVVDREHVCNFFLIKALELNHLPAAVEVAKICLVTDFYFAYSWLKHHFLQGSAEVIEFFKECSNDLRSEYLKTYFKSQNRTLAKQLGKLSSYLNTIKLQQLFSTFKSEDALYAWVKQSEQNVTKLGLTKKESITEAESFFKALLAHKCKRSTLITLLMQEPHLTKIMKYGYIPRSIAVDNKYIAKGKKCLLLLEDNLKDKYKTETFKDEEKTAKLIREEILILKNQNIAPLEIIYHVLLTLNKGDVFFANAEILVIFDSIESVLKEMKDEFGASLKAVFPECKKRVVEFFKHDAGQNYLVQEFNLVRIKLRDCAGTIQRILDRAEQTNAVKDVDLTASMFAAKPVVEAMAGDLSSEDSDTDSDSDITAAAPVTTTSPLFRHAMTTKPSTDELKKQGVTELVVDTMLNGSNAVSPAPARLTRRITLIGNSSLPNAAVSATATAMAGDAKKHSAVGAITLGVIKPAVSIAVSTATAASDADPEPQSLASAPSILQP